ncbi:hypothetical protein JA9_002311 [Meyerozyma sp. JA9]|nr:hypothetical protein JA9_002311 [Meyerozyma sp. JA9]
MEDVAAGTPRVLRECASLLSTPTHNTYIDTPDYTKYSTHPDIQYFRSVKAKNHFQYHRLKRASRPIRERIYAAASKFDPYSRPQLLQRLASYTALNWSLPESAWGSEKWPVSELKCAQNGWRCVSIRNSNLKNHLVCDVCHHQLILRYNDAHDSVFNFDPEEVAQLNENLARSYLEHIATKAHGTACPWSTLETPLQGVYYMRPFLKNTNETLLAEYRRALGGLVRHWRVLQPQISVPLSSQNHIDDSIVHISTEILLAGENEDKENLASLAASVPHWVFTVAQLGWELRSQKFASQTVYLMVCTGCNARWVLNSFCQNPTSNSEPQLSPSNVLTPCEHRATVEEDEEFDPWDHKSWCCRIQDSAHLADLLRRGLKRQAEDSAESRKAARTGI